MEEDLYAALLADAGVTAIVADRISWVDRPRAEALPALVLQVISRPFTYTLHQRDGLVGVLVQFDAWGETYDQVVALARAVVAFTDSLTAAPFQAAFLETQRDGFEPGDGPQPDGAIDLYRTSLDVRVWHRQAA